MNSLSPDQQQELIQTVTSIHNAGLIIIPLVFLLTLAAVLFTRRNQAGNAVLALYFFLVLVLIGSCPEPITKIWLAVCALVSGGSALFLQNLHLNGKNLSQWWAEKSTQLKNLW